MPKSRYENGSGLHRTEILSEIESWSGSGRVFDKTIGVKHIEYLESGKKDFRIAYFPNAETVLGIRKRIIADRKVSELISLDGLAEFLYLHCDPNAIMMMRHLVLLYPVKDKFDNDKMTSFARKRLEDATGDAYAQTVCGGDLIGMMWNAKQAVIIDVKKILKTVHEADKQYGHDPDSMRVDFESGFMQTLIHELMHLAAECVEFKPLKGQYAKYRGSERYVEDYGIDETLRIRTDRSRRRILERLFKKGAKI